MFQCCPICFERWENSGIHRLASLKCGHLFGQSCIEKWLLGQGGKCPQCNVKASKKDIRLIYAKTLKVLVLIRYHTTMKYLSTMSDRAFHLTSTNMCLFADLLILISDLQMLDTSERDEALASLNQEKKLRQDAELESAQLRLNYQLSLDECKRLKDEVERYKSALDVMRAAQPVSHNAGPTTDGDSTTQMQEASLTNQKSFVFEKTIKINDNGHCRVMTYCDSLSTLCISQQSSNSLFPGFGIKKLNSVDFKTSQYVAIHSQAIRDVVFHSAHSLLLTASLDKTMKLTSLSSNAIAQT